MSLDIESLKQQDWKNILFSFEGRALRNVYWLAGCVLPIIFLVLLNALLSVIGGLFSTIIMFIVNICMLWLSLAIGAKRLHDLDHSAWFLLLHLIPGLGSLVLLIWLGFVRGTEGPNRFGITAASIL